MYHARLDCLSTGARGRERKRLHASRSLTRWALPTSAIPYPQKPAGPKGMSNCDYSNFQWLKSCIHPQSAHLRRQHCIYKGHAMHTTNSRVLHH